MESGSTGLIGAAALLGITHTALGPDHTLPFVMLARAGRWSMARTLTVTAICGVAHVVAALLLLAATLALGSFAADLTGYTRRLAGLDAWRGSIAAWGFIGLGLAYVIWGVRRAIRSGAGLEPHDHGAGMHIHRGGGAAHRHPPVAPDRHAAGSAATFWTLFALLVLGPCEPLIILFLPLAIAGDGPVMIASGLAFGVSTVATMVVLVAAGRAGISRLPLGPLERWSHAMAGAVIAGTGAAVVLFGL